MALMSRSVGASEQGQLQGANASLSGIANLFGPSLFTLTFAYAIGASGNWHLPGAPFIISSALVALATLTAWRVTRALKPAA
jgi:MFS transporter, DHA1 family, tetracycline resistance protein